MSILKSLFEAGEEVGTALRRSVGNRLRHKLVERRFSGHPAAVRDTLDWTWSGKPNRIALVNLLLHDRVDGKYLEIGCDNDALFDSVAVANKVGVDPARGGTLRLESDQFFARNAEKFDAIWIDGLHTYDQIRRDVVNSMAALAPGGWAGIHDLLPRNWIEGYSPRLFEEGAWSGDVWKVAFELAVTPGVDFKIVNIDRGVGVFRLTEPAAVLADRRREMEPTTFAYLAQHIKELPVVEWDEAFRWIVGAKKAART